MIDLDLILNGRGVSLNLGAHVIAACFNRAGSFAAFALGDGTVRLTDTEEWTTAGAHKGAVLALAPHPLTAGFVSGGDDGQVNAIGLDRVVTPMASLGSKWVEHLAVFAGRTPYIAAAAGKNVHLLNGLGGPIRVFPHPSTVTGIAFDAKGKRLAAAHYNGASLWFTASTATAPNVLEWKGSHTGVAVHPAGEAVVTSMQENALHGWTLPEKRHMRMAGYPAKTESFGFTKSGRWMATGGADAVVLWPFFGGGPIGKAPVELGGGDGAIIKRVACHPEHEAVAAGFDTGLVIVVDIAQEKILPVCGPGRGAVSALGWNASGSHLAVGTASGFAAVVDFSKEG